VHQPFGRARRRGNRTHMRLHAEGDSQGFALFDPPASSSQHRAHDSARGSSAKYTPGKVVTCCAPQPAAYSSVLRNQSRARAPPEAWG